MRCSLERFENAWCIALGAFVFKWAITVDFSPWQCAYCAAVCLIVATAIRYYRTHDDKKIR